MHTLKPRPATPRGWSGGSTAIYFFAGGGRFRASADIGANRSERKKTQDDKCCASHISTGRALCGRSLRHPPRSPMRDFPAISWFRSNWCSRPTAGIRLATLGFPKVAGAASVLIEGRLRGTKSTLEGSMRAACFSGWPHSALLPISVFRKYRGLNRRPLGECGQEKKFALAMTCGATLLAHCLSTKTLLKKGSSDPKPTAFALCIAANWP